MESLFLCSFPKPCGFASFATGGNGRRSSNVKLQLVPRSQISRRNASERLRFTGFQRHPVKNAVQKINERSGLKFVVNAASNSLSNLGTMFVLLRVHGIHFWWNLMRFTDIEYNINLALSGSKVVRLLDGFLLWGVGVVASLLMNIYIVGLNQLADIEIDKVNKPYLPLASGEYSLGTGIMIIVSSAIMSFVFGWVSGSWPLFWALLISFFLGTAYSVNLPFLRWKRFAVIAASCIVAVRAVIVQVAFYLHMQSHVYKRPAVFSKPVIFATVFMSFFSVVIALFKDIPDITGDRIFGIQSFTVKLGQERVFWICISLLQMAYAVAVVVGAASCNPWAKGITVLGHLLLASLLWIRAKSIDLKSAAAITSFYMFIWKLFYAEYFLIPLVR